MLVVSTVDDERKALALGADAYCVKPIDRQTLLHDADRGWSTPESSSACSIVDDEEISRYVLRQHLLTPHHVDLRGGERRRGAAHRARPSIRTSSASTS